MILAGPILPKPFSTLHARPTISSLITFVPLSVAGGAVAAAAAVTAAAAAGQLGSTGNGGEAPLGAGPGSHTLITDVRGDAAALGPDLVPTCAQVPGGMVNIWDRVMW